jgi:HEAT repeat protein
MSIKMLCPACGAAHDLADALEGKTVKCRKCEESFTVKAGRAKRNEGVSKDERTRPAARGPRREEREEDDRPRRRRRVRDEDDRPPRKPARKSSGSGALWLSLGGVAAGLLLVCCGGGTAVYLAIKPAVDAELARAQQGPGPGRNVGGGRGFPPEGVQPDVARGPENVIHDAGEALAALQSGERPKEDEALRWLANTAPQAGEPRRAEVAGAIARLVPQRRDRPGTLDIDALGRWGTPDSVPVLVAILDEIPAAGFAPRGAAAVRALGGLKYARAAEGLVRNWRYFGGPDTEWALLQIGPAAKKDVLTRLNDPDHTVRTGARRLLKQYSTRPEVLAERSLTDLAGEGWARRGAAADWLAQAQPDAALRPKVVKALDGLLAETLALDDNAFRRGDPGTTPQWASTRAALAVAHWAGKDDLPALERVVRATRTRLNEPAVMSRLYGPLGATEDERAVPLLIDLARRHQAQAAAQALKRLGPAGERGLRAALEEADPNGRPLLRDLCAQVGLKGNTFLTLAVRDLRSTDRARRKDGLEAVGRVAVEDARRAEVVAAVRPYFDGDDAGLRKLADAALLRWVARDDVPLLIKLLESPHRAPPERLGIITALGAAKDEKAVEALIRQLSWTASSHAEAALIASGPVAEKPVRKLLDSPNLETRFAATRILKGLGVKENLDFKLAWRDANSDNLETRRSGLRLLANTVGVPDNRKAEVLKLVEKLKDDPDQGTRQIAVYLLTQQATKEQVPTLLKLLEGQAEGARGHVINALGRLKEGKAAPLLVKALADHREWELADRALRKIGPPAEKALLDGLKSDPDKIGALCARLLGQVGGKDSLPALEKIADDKTAANKDLATAARGAIDAIRKRK